MSNLIRSCKAVSTGQSSPPPAQPTAITAPAQMEQLSRDPPTSHAPASSASSVAQPLSARHRHCPPSMSDTTSTDGTGASGSQPAKKNTRGPCRQLKTAKVTRVGCPKELEGQEDSWAWLCGHFQESDYVKVAKANKGNRNKKTFLHHSGSKPFSYRMEARRRRGSKFPEIDVFGNVYVRAGNELAESLHATMVERSQMVLHESASQLPPETPLESVDPPQDAGFQILIETLDQTLERRPGTYCRGMGNARRREPVGPSSSQSNQVTALTAEVAELNTQLASYSTHMAQMSQVLASIVRSSVPAPTVGPSSTSDSIQPEHGHQTSALIDHVQTSDPHFQNDDIDFGTLF
ncbi:unnamed protein product [Prunus brigantina]